MVGIGLGWIGMLREEGSVALRGIKTLPRTMATATSEKGRGGQTVQGS